MLPLVVTELTKLGDHSGRGQPGHQYLARVDGYGSVLTGVVDLDDAVTEFTGNRLRNCFHAV